MCLLCKKDDRIPLKYSHLSVFLKVNGFMLFVRKSVESWHLRTENLGAITEGISHNNYTIRRFHRFLLTMHVSIVIISNILILTMFLDFMHKVEIMVRQTQLIY